MPKAIRAIVARFSYPFSRGAMDIAMQHHSFSFCAIISTGDPVYFTSLPREDQEWFLSSEIRGAGYAHIDWSTLLPLDAALIEAMRGCEAVFMDMVYRLEWKKSVSYEVRMQWYLRHLRFWNNYLERNRINLYVSAWIPHEIPDIVIYHLCKLKGIPVLYFHTTTIRDTCLAEHDIEKSSIPLALRFADVVQKYADEHDPDRIPLGDPYLGYYRSLTLPMGEKPAIENFKRPTYWMHVRRLLLEKPVQFLLHICGYASPSGWLRGMQAVRRWRAVRLSETFYDTHAVDPEYDARYIYLPLHFQPEASTTPMGGAYTDQLMMIELLQAHVPPNVLLYIKEHPRRSGWLVRSPHYYRRLLALPNVRLIARSANTFQLREHCAAVATVTGSAGFEALFRGKPVLLFGHRFYQYAHGVFPIRTSDDCAAAVRDIFGQGTKPTLRDTRLFLKAMEDICVQGVLDPWKLKPSVTRLPEKEHTRAMGEALTQEIRLLQEEIATVTGRS